VRTLALVIAALVSAGTAAAETAAVNYLLQCQGCHREDGAGTPGAVPALADFVAEFLTVPGGREYLVRVPGSAQSPLSDAALAELLNWILQRFGPDEAAASAAPFSEAEVAKLRRSPLIDVETTRRALVERIGEPG
jgi:mono/diheme cytochrome c family protein